MFNKRYIGVFLIVFFVGCSSEEGKKIGKVLPGTNTAVVGVSLGEDGVPQETVKEVVVSPGNKVIYAGPDEFSIIFKNRKTPNQIVENKSERGVVVIEIPADIFQQKEFAEEFKNNNSLVFNYGIKVGDKELDPPIRVIPPSN